MTKTDQTPVEIALVAIRLYADMHPRPAAVTQRQAAEMIGRSEPTIRKMIRAGEIALNAVGMIPISEIDRLLSHRAA